MNQELLNLPWQTLLTLASGYAGYFIANTGVREHHKTIDVAFSSLVFGFFAAFIYELTMRGEIGILAASGLAFAAAVLAGGLWRRWGRGWLRSALRLSKVSDADDLPSAWHSLFDVKGIRATQLSVQLKDGTWLQCDELERFENAPGGACVFGGTGDLLLYVTDIREPGKESQPNTYVDDPNWGFEVTYLPASVISRVDFRRRKVTTS